MSENDRLVKQITPKSEDFSRWYVEVVQKAELADYTPDEGHDGHPPLRLRHLGEHPAACSTTGSRHTGHVNAYFPLFIPESFLKKEAEHVEGFAPEVAWVTIGGKEELEERLAVRPTSEAIIGHMYSKWIKSWRDLPVLINQWANIVRWEKVTRPVPADDGVPLAGRPHLPRDRPRKAEAETLQILDLYKDFCETELAIPVIAGRKSLREKFAGASMTYAIEALMSDGKALQMGTSHNLGQHFSKAFDIKFEDRNQTLQYVWQTSWGMTTRTIGALIMAHGDDSGLRLPAPGRARPGRHRADLRRQLEGDRPAGRPGRRRDPARGRPARRPRRPRGGHPGLEVLRIRDARRSAADRDRAPRRQGRPGRPRPARPEDQGDRPRWPSLAARVPALLDEIQAELFRRPGVRLEANIRTPPTTTTSRRSWRTSAASSGRPGAAAKPAKTGSRPRPWPRSGSSRSTRPRRGPGGPASPAAPRARPWPTSPDPTDGGGRLPLGEEYARERRRMTDPRSGPGASAIRASWPPWARSPATCSSPNPARPRPTPTSPCPSATGRPSPNPTSSPI